MAIISTSSPAAMNAPFPDHQAWGSPRQWPGNVPSSAIQEVAIMVATDRVRALFADARDLQADALEMLEQGLLRNAAEKAWGATKRATDALARRPERNRSGPQRAPLASGCWNPSTQRYEGHAWCAATTPARDLSTASAFTPASASPSTRLSGGSGRRPTTSTPPSVWLIDTTNNLPQPWADRPGQRQVGSPSAISGLPRAW